MTDPAATVHRVRLVDSDEDLYRPIIAAWLVQGKVSFQAFMLNAADRADDNRMSISRSSVTDARAAYEARYQHIWRRCNENGKPFNPPVGVYAVTVEQTDDVTLESGDRPLSAWDDSMNAGVPFDHGHIDYTAVAQDKGLHQFVAKALLDAAEKNDWKYRRVD